MDIDVSNGTGVCACGRVHRLSPLRGSALCGARSQGLRPGLMNFAPSGLVWWCSRQRRRPWSRDLHESRSMGRDLHGSRSAWDRDLHGGRVLAWSALLHRVLLQGGVSERRYVVVSDAGERFVGLIVRAWRGFVVLTEQAAAHIAAAAQARAPVPTRVVPTS